MGQIIEIDYQNRPQYLYRLYKDRVAFNSYRKCLVIEVTDPRNVTLYGGMITCLLYAVLEDRYTIYLLCISETSETVTESE